MKLRPEFDPEIERFGFVKEATLPQFKKKGFINRTDGAYICHDKTGRFELRIPTDGSLALFGGPGSGKSAGFFNQQLLTAEKLNSSGIVVFDPRLETYSITHLYLTMLGYHVVCLNNSGSPWAPQHRTNPWDHLTIDNDNVVEDNQKALLDIIAPSALMGGVEKWWETDCFDWALQVNLHIIERDGKTSIPAFYREICNLRGQNEDWINTMGLMLDSRFPDVVRFAHQIFKLADDGNEGFNAPMNTLFTRFLFMQSPNNIEMLSGNDFSMQDVVNPKKKIIIFIGGKLEHLPVNKPMWRAIIGSAIQAKLRNPFTNKVSMLLDECGMLSFFPSIVELFTFCRGVGGGGIFAACSWQDYSQCVKAFGIEIAKEVLASALVRLFVRVQSPDSARLVSQLGGTGTISFDPLIDQSNYKRQKQQAMIKFMQGGGMLEAMADVRHYQQGTQFRQKQARATWTEGEVLNSQNVFGFAGACGVGPFKGVWKLFFEQREFAGRYLGTPYHDYDSVKIQGRFGAKTVPIIEESVPKKLAHLPQYNQTGTWRFPKGYRPNVRGIKL